MWFTYLARADETIFILVDGSPQPPKLCVVQLRLAHPERVTDHSIKLPWFVRCEVSSVKRDVVGSTMH